MSQDTLSGVLRTVRLRGAVFYYVSCEGDWVAEAPASREIAGAVMPGVDHIIEYHVVTSGSCWAAIVGEQPRRLEPGDTILLPHGDAHVVSSAPGMRADPNPDAYYEMKHYDRPFRVHHGPSHRPDISAMEGAAPWRAGAGSAATLVCGFIGCDVRPFNPLLAALPRMLHLSANGADDWSAQFAQLAVSESGDRRPGSEALLERLGEMMFVDAIRRHAESLEGEATGWLAGLRDRFVGRALTLMHERPANDWSVEDLAQRIGLSRSALYERFVELVGQPPMHYLTQWRMQLASRLLRDSQLTIAGIALEVGYESEAAFARAFKRQVGAPPGAWRRAQSLASGEPSGAGLLAPAHASGRRTRDP